MIKKLISTILITSLTLGAFLQPAEGHHTKRYNSKGHRIKRAQRYNGQVKVASWYGHNDGYHGRKTASGKIFNKYSNMCAHNGFRFGTKLKVTNVSTGRFTVCNVQDTGAFTRLGRSLDLSYGSFGKIANPNQGLVRVKIEKIN
jgi:rare lipoprotein A